MLAHLLQYLNDTRIDKNGIRRILENTSGLLALFGNSETLKKSSTEIHWDPEIRRQLRRRQINEHERTGDVEHISCPANIEAKR